ncbi:hypothetical protein [Photobacterium damselae]|uniref:hypothetical protein n=1 Tax=Photobacterium damselae TaxID=38293 RepID=UPI001F23791E|nr:hypothetical protein [Photobacterium damselae]UKA04870.1 hypothetical protein IHC89_21745 [Photobacterium damselae subsp. damselae]
MKTTVFQITTIQSHNNKSIETSFDVYLHETKGKATFFFDQDIYISKKDFGNKLKVELKSPINNIIGFIISRIERLAAFNPSFVNIKLDEGLWYLRNTTICDNPSQESLMLDGMTVPSTAKVVVSVVDENSTIQSTEYSYDQIKTNGLSFAVKTITLPAKTDKEGNFQYCRNSSFNRALQGGMVSLDDGNLPLILKQFDEYTNRISTMARILRSHNVAVLSIAFINRYVCMGSNQRWASRILGSLGEQTAINDFEFYKSHSSSNDDSIKFRIDDLINLEK